MPGPYFFASFIAVKDVYQTHFECGLYNED